MNPDANERNGVFLNQVPQLRWGTNRLLPEEYQNMSSMSVTSVQVRTMGRSKCRDHNTNKFGEICIWFCSPRPLEKQSRWISKHLDSIQNILTIVLACNVSLLQTPVADIPFPSLLAMCSCVHCAAFLFESCSFKRLLCQIQLQIYKGKHITWNQIRLMTFCRIHSSLVVWHFEDGARGTQHNK